MIHTPGPSRTVLVVIALMLILATMASNPVASQTPPPTETATQEGAMVSGEPLASITMDLTAGELTWKVSKLESGSETDAATRFEPGFIYTLDDPLLLFFDEGTPLKRLQADTAYSIEDPVKGRPVAMMAETPVPYVTIGVSAPDGTDDPNTALFQVEAGEYELSLWLIDTSAPVTEETGQRISAQENPLLVLVRSGEVDAPPAEPGGEPRRLVEGDWAVIAPTDRLQVAEGAESPVLLFGTLDQPNLTEAQSSEPVTNGDPSAPQESGGQGPTGGAPAAATETPVVDPTDVPTAEVTAPPCHVDNQGECGPAPMPETTIPSATETSGESGSFEPDLEIENNPPILLPTQESGNSGAFEPDLEIENSPPILLPTQESGSSGAFDSAPIVNLPIISTGSSVPATGPFAVERVEVSCFAHIADADGDGLPDACEEEHGSDPSKPDSDGDGLVDGDEVSKHGSNPTLFDTDGDTLTDGDEVTIHGSSPTQTDSDSDDLNDGSEVNQYNTDPAVFDSDGDGLGDGYDLGFGTDPLNSDFDGDGLLDGDEVNVYGTSPKETDADGDGLTDGEEILTYGTDPYVADIDGDCLSDRVEINETGSSPFTADTDGDGDGDQIDDEPNNPEVGDDSSAFNIGCG